MNLARSSLKLFAANITGSVLQFLGIAYFARVLGPSPMGVFFLFQALLGMLAIPADFGIRGAVEKRISEGDSQGAFLSSGIALKLIPISVITLGILLFQPWINNYLGAEIAVVLAIALILQEAAQLAIVVLKAELRVGETAVLQVARQAAWLGVGSLFVSQGFEALALIYGLLAGLSLVLIWGWYKVSVKPDIPSREHAWSLFNYGKHNVISSIGGYFYSWMDVAIIGLFLTQSHVGTYEIAWRVTGVTLLLSQAIGTSIFPQVSEWDASGTKDRIEDLLPTVMVPSLLLVIPAFFGTILFSEEILGLVFGSEYTGASLVLILLMADKIFQAIQLIIAKSLQAIDEPKSAAYATLISVVTNGALNIVLVLEFGIIGAAVATVVSSLINDFLHIVFLRRHMVIRFPKREVAECIVASSVMSLILLGLRNILEINSIFTLIFIISIGVIIYFSMVILSPNLRVHIQNMVRGAWV